MAVPLRQIQANVGRLREGNYSEAEDAIGVFMKDILTVITFVMGAPCFAMFPITVKPDPLSAVPTRGKSMHRKMAVSREPVGRNEQEGPPTHQ